MKTTIIFLLALLLAASGCENPARTSGREPEPISDEEREWREGTPSFTTRYHPEDTMFGHPRGFIYLPGEPPIPYDTLKNTHGFSALLYCDTIGWGVYHTKITRGPYERGPWARWSGEYSFYYGVNGETISGGRFSRSRIGVLENEPPNAVNGPNYKDFIVNPFRPLWRTSLVSNAHEFGGWEVTYKTGKVFMPGIMEVRVFPDDHMNTRLGIRQSRMASGNANYWLDNYLGRLINKPIPEDLLPRNGDSTSVEIIAYRPRRIYMRPLDKAIDERSHRRGEPLRLTWQGDPNRMHDSIIISVSTYNNTFPKEFGFDYGSIKPLSFGKGPYETGREIDITYVDVNSPRTPNQARGPRPFDLVPSLEGREDDHKRIFMQYRDATPLPHIEWNLTVFEVDGTNVVEIPASVFEQFPSNRLIEVRAYRWYDVLTFFPGQRWLAGENKTFRSYNRTATFSYGGFYLED